MSFNRSAQNVQLTGGNLIIVDIDKKIRSSKYEFANGGSDGAGTSVNLQDVTEQGASTDRTVTFSNVTTAFTTTSNVGIGTTSLTSRLTVQGAAAAPGVLSALRLRNSSDGGIGLHFDNNVCNLANIEARVTSTGAGTDNGILSFSTSNDAVIAERMRITSSGNVGIGTDNPLAKLQVNGNIRLYTTNGDGNELRGIFNVGGAADPLSFTMYKADASTIGAFITADGDSYFNGGNVGIGTNLPSSKLHVVGTSNITGNATFGDNVILGNGKYLKLTRTSGSLVLDVLGIEQGTDDTRLLITGDFNIKNGSLVSLLKVTVNGKVSLDDNSSQSKLAVRGGATTSYPSSSSVDYTLSLNDPTSSAINVGGSIIFQGFKTSTTAIGNFSGIVGKKENGTAGNEAGYLGFLTSDSSGTLGERMRITSSGAVVQEGINVRKTKSGGQSVTFTITVNGVGYWAPGYATIRVAATRGGLQEHYGAMYFLRITYYSGSSSVASYNIGGATGDATISVTSANVSGNSVLTITVSDVGATSDYIIADIDATFQTGIISII